MLFARNALPPGPQACFFAEKKKVKGEGKIFLVDELGKNGYT